MSHLDATIEETAQRLQRGELSSRALTEAMLARIGAENPRLNAYLRVDAEGALRAAEESDSRRARGEARGLLDGVPLAVKDLLCTKGLVTTAASRMLEHWVPPFDATAVSKLKEAGAVLLGKLNLDEFAMGSSNENSAFGPVRNPWDTERTPGGSSGGSAAAVAAGLCLGALGTDTGGSIRQPAAFTGVVGLKPTYGRVSRSGVIAFASSLDQVGPLGRTVRDVALQFDAISGHDPLDSTSLELPATETLSTIEDGVRGLRVGVPSEALAEGLDPEVESAVRESIRQLESLGATIHEVKLPHVSHATAVYYLVACAEASSNLARFDGVRFGHRTADPKGLLDMYLRTRAEGFGSEVKRRIMLGTFALSAGYYDAYYLKAQKVRTLIRQDYEAAFAEVDLVLTPTSPTAAFKLGEKTGDPLQMYLADVFTIPANLAGLPALSLPCGFTESGLPIGLQLTGRVLEEATLLRAARAYERETPWHRRTPRKEQ